jgi:hypothetical protein
MNSKITLTVTREKHLDHMVRVVPLIVMFYGIQYYMVWQMKLAFASNHFLVLGFFLVSMIAGFIAYDRYHKIDCYEDRLEIKWFFIQHTILYKDVLAVEVPEEEKSFGTVKLLTARGTHTFFFVDQTKLIKEIILKAHLEVKEAA